MDNKISLRLHPDLWRCLWSNHCLADHYYLEFGSAMAMMGARRPLPIATVGLIILLSLPFLLFVTTLLNHIELAAVDAQTKMETMPGNVSTTARTSNQLICQLGRRLVLVDRTGKI